MKRIIAVFAHPDDEGMVAGTLARYASNGAHIGLVCATKGEAGEISDSSLATPENLGAVRERELRCACDVIGIDELFLLGYCDSGMQGTPANERSTAFIKAADEEVQRKLVEIYRRFKPDLVITFEPFGWYGHPDHVAAGKHATAAFHLSGSPTAFPGEGEPWQPGHLYQAALLAEKFREIFTVAREMGLDVGDYDDSDFDERENSDEKITHTMDVTPYLDTKTRSMRCHETQFGEDNLFRKLPQDLIFDLFRFEYFIQVIPPVAGGGLTAED
jgi:LmbE family N-acetylglucosaminyl deacetylase